MTDNLVPWIADLVVIGGLIVMSAAIYGMIWLPDLYTRLHAAGKGVVLAAVPILFTLTASGDPTIILRALLVSAFLLLTTPVATHAIGFAAYRQKEPMRTPDIVDESGRLLPQGAEEPGE